MSSPFPTLAVCLCYVYIVKVSAAITEFSPDHNSPPQCLCFVLGARTENNGEPETATFKECPSYL